MADNQTTIQANAQVNLTDNASGTAKKIADSFGAVASSAESARKNISSLEDVLLLIETRRRQGSISAEEAAKESEKITAAINKQAEAHNKNAAALKKEAEALIKSAEASKIRAKYAASPEGQAAKKASLDQRKTEEENKTDRANKRAEAQAAQREIDTERNRLRAESLKLRKSQSRYGANSVAANTMSTISGNVRNRGFNGRVTSDILDIGAATALGGPIGLAGAAISKLTQAFFDFRDATLEAYGSIEKIKTQMSVVFGGQIQSNSQFNNIAEYATKSPFGIENMAEYATLLKQSGIYSSELLETLKMIGDTAGGDNDRMKRIANNYAQIVAVGKASMLDMRQFAYAGIPIYKEVADYLKVSQAQLRKMISDGKVDAETIEAVFKRMTGKGGVFFEATAKGATTLAARKQNLEDIATLAKAQLGEYVKNIANPTGVTGGNETMILNAQENFYQALYNWGERTNLIHNVNRIASDDKRISQLEKEKIAIQNDSTLKDEEKTKLISYIDSQIAALKARSSNDTKISTYGQSQVLAEKQQANMDRFPTFEKEYKNAKAEFSTAYQAWRKEYGFPTDALAFFGEGRVHPNIMGFLGGKGGKFAPSSETVTQWLNYFSGSSPLDEQVRSALVKLGVVTAERERINKENGISGWDNQIKKPSAKSNFETEFAAGSVVAINAASSNLDAIEKAQKSNNGKQTILGILRQKEAETPEGKAKAEAEENQILINAVKEARTYVDIIKSISNEDGSINRIKMGGLSLEQLVRLNTNFVSDDAKHYSGMATDYVTSLSRSGQVRDKQAETDFKELRSNLYLMSSNLLQLKDLPDGIHKSLWDLFSSTSGNLTGVGVENVKTIFEKFRIAKETIEAQLANPDISEEQKKYLSNILKVLEASFTQQKFDASELANFNLDLLNTNKTKSKTDSINSLDLQPLWKRIIASATGLNVDMMEGSTPSAVLSGQWQQKNSRELVSSAITSVIQEGFNGGKKNDFTNAYRLLSFSEMKKLGAGSKGGNLNDIENTASEKKVNSKAKATNVNALGDTYEVAQIDWRATEDNIMQAMSKGLLSSETLDIMKSAYEKQSSVAMSLLQKAFETSEDGSYVKDQKFAESFVNAFSGFDVAAGSTLTADIKDEATGTYKRETLTWDNEAKKWKRANGEFIDSTTKVKYSLDDLSTFIQDFIDKNNDKVSDIGQQGSFQNEVEALKTSRETDQKDALANQLTREYLIRNPDTTQKELSYIQKQYGRGLDEYYNGSVGFDYFDYKASNQAYRNSFYNRITDSTFNGFADGNKNIVTLNADNFKGSEKIARQTAVANAMNDAFYSNSPAIKSNVFSDYRNAQRLKSFGSKLEGYRWEDVRRDVGANALMNISAKMRQQGWAEKSGFIASPDYSMNKEMFNSLKSQYSDIYEQTEGEGLEKDQNFLDNLMGDTSTLDSIGDKFGNINQRAITFADTVDGLSKGIKSMGMQFATSAITGTFESLGENWGDVSEGMSDAGQKMKELGKAALSNLSSLFVQAGLSYIAANPNWGGLAIGAALIAAGGMAGILSGMLSSDEDEDDDQTAKLKQIKSDLADLLEQARNDAIYYENELRHQTALSTNEGYSKATKVSSVHDALISSNGNIITTDPKDYLIATKHPNELVGGSGGVYKPNIVFNVKNNSSAQVSSSYSTKTDDDGNVEITAIIEELTANYIASSKSDDAFAARQARLQGRNVVA
jgi:tape measure domain-containing protein